VTVRYTANRENCFLPSKRKKQSWGEMETFAEYSGDSAFSWGRGKQCYEYLPHRNLNGIAYVRELSGLTPVMTSKHPAQGKTK
jgi:hypothetical protein